jgi:hypothetical protein
VPEDDINALSVYLLLFTFTNLSFRCLSNSSSASIISFFFPSKIKYLCYLIPAIKILLSNPSTCGSNDSPVHFGTSLALKNSENQVLGGEEVF